MSSYNYCVDCSTEVAAIIYDVVGHQERLLATTGHSARKLFVFILVVVLLLLLLVVVMIFPL